MGAGRNRPACASRPGWWRPDRFHRPTPTSSFNSKPPTAPELSAFEAIPAADAAVPGTYRTRGRKALAQPGPSEFHDDAALRVAVGRPYNDPGRGASN